MIRIPMLFTIGELGSSCIMDRFVARRLTEWLGEVSNSQLAVTGMLNFGRRIRAGKGKSKVLANQCLQSAAPKGLILRVRVPASSIIGLEIQRVVSQLQDTKEERFKHYVHSTMQCTVEVMMGSC